jgi:hypothetical protein
LALVPRQRNVAVEPPPSSVRARAGAYIAGMDDLTYWTTKLTEAERRVSTRQTKRLTLAKGELRRLLTAQLCVRTRTRQISAIPSLSPGVPPLALLTWQSYALKVESGPALKMLAIWRL